LSRIKILRIDDDINRKYLFLMKKYGEKSDLIVDDIIATEIRNRPPLFF
jgi:hypothetical protein